MGSPAVVDISAAELVHDLRRANRRIVDLEAALSAMERRAERAERDLEGKAREATRLLAERDAALEAAEAARALQLQADAMFARVRLPTFGYESGLLAPTLRRLLPALRRRYQPGLAPTLRIVLRPALCRYKDLPDIPVPNGRQSETIRVLSAMVRDRQVPLVLIVEGPDSRHLAVLRHEEMQASIDSAPELAIDDGTVAEGALVAPPGGADAA